jgi:alkylation response protein AidB-like acyl-CoA dehydrogenase
MLWCLTQGATTVLQFEGTEKQQQLFLPNMFAGKWGGTMCLTEPGAGSEVGNCSTKAFATDTRGLYKIKGLKCFITSGDHDCVENFVHLVLAKTEGAKAGTAGISLFIVPKFWVNDDVTMGDWNDVTTVGIEHKMESMALPPAPWPLAKTITAWDGWSETSCQLTGAAKAWRRCFGT